jgi:uncharacterized protein involved in response to NO
MIPKAFFAAIHRGMFFCGAVQSVLTMLFWAIDLGARRAGLWAAPAWPLPSPWLHALLLLYGVFPFFIFGFILTAGPRWQGYGETPPRVFVPAFWLLASGWLIAWTGVIGVPALLAPGLVLALAGWGVAARHLWRIAAWPSDERRHIRLAATAVTLGAVGLGIFAAYAATQEPLLARLAINLGLWGFLVPVFVLVIHRMLPFFSSGIIRGFVGYRPYWALWAVVGGSAGHGLLSFLELPQWTWLFDLPAALGAGWLTLKWRLRESFAATLLAVLHVGFAWCGLSFALFALHSMLLLAGQGGLGLLPLHALTLGFLASTLIGMASRVTMGHSGLPLVGDAVMWRAFWTMQAATVLRMAGDFVQPPLPFDLSFIAALLWLGAFGAWTVKYAPKTWRPRADGQPG